MARKRTTKIETPGQESAADDDLDLIGTADVRTDAELNAATAGATVVDTEPSPADTTARNAALSGLNSQGFSVISKFEALGYTDDNGHPLTNSVEFIALVKQATSATHAGAAVVSEDGARRVNKAPVLTDRGWHIPE